MKTIEQIYSARNRGPWSISPALSKVISEKERSILGSRTCEVFPHKLNRDCDFYMSDECTTYYCPVNGQFTLRGQTEIVG